jgi:tetratricopeptide (TPR) repeat protein
MSDEKPVVPQPPIEPEAPMEIVFPDAAPTPEAPAAPEAEGRVDRPAPEPAKSVERPRNGAPRADGWLRGFQIALIASLALMIFLFTRSVLPERGASAETKPADPKPVAKVDLPVAPKVDPAPKADPEPAPTKKEEPGPSLEDLTVDSLIEEAAELELTDPGAAAALYAKAAAIRPRRADLWRKAADGFLAAGKGKEAAEAYRALLDIDPACGAALNNLAVLELREGRLDEAEKLLTKGSEVAPSANVWYNLANLHLRRQQLSKAADGYRRALEYDGNHPGARYNLALVLEKQGRFAEAARALSQPGFKTGGAGVHRGRLLAMAGGPEAVRALDEARISGDALAVAAIAAGFRAAGELEKALALYDRAHELAPADAGILNNRGAVKRLMDRTEDARADFEAAAKADPKLAEAHFNLGLLHDEKGEYLKALEAYAAALKVRPAMPEAQNNVGVLYLKVGQAQKAADLLRKPAETFAPARLNLAWAYLALDWRDRALAELKAYVKMVPEAVDPEAVKAIQRLETK